MKKILLSLFVIVFPVLIMMQESTMAQDMHMQRIPPGVYQPFYNRDGEDARQVATFMMQETAVTNAEFLSFVKVHPEWRRSKVSRLLADAHYLSRWEGDLKIGDKVQKDAPVVNVSWFAAKAYCHWKGGRLPTTAEWEYAAAGKPADGKVRDLTKYALAWNAQASPDRLPVVGSTYKNQYGLFDMNGLVWEWTFDFNNFTGTKDSRGNPINRKSFCGGASLNVSDPKDYPSFLRYSFRSSLEGRFCIRSLGFRCVKDIKTEE